MDYNVERSHLLYNETFCAGSLTKQDVFLLTIHHWALFRANPKAVFHLTPLNPLLSPEIAHIKREVSA